MLTKRDLEDHDAVVLVIRREDGKVLTLFHAKFGFWTLPLGKAEVGQTPAQAATAEAEEECGIDVGELRRLCTGTRVYRVEGQPVVTFFHVFEITRFLGTPSNMEPVKHPEMQYMSLSELASLERSSDGTRMFLEHMAEREPQALDPKHDIALPPVSDVSKNVRIGLSGAAGAGKTTFAHYLRDTYALTIHPEAVRPWLKQNGNLKYSDLTDYQFLRLQLDLMDSYERSDAAVFDRTPLDSVVYSMRIRHLFDYEAFCRRAMTLLEDMDVIVFFQPHPPFLREDGVRITDVLHQIEISARTFVWACDHGLKDKVVVYDHEHGNVGNAVKLAPYLRLPAAS